MSDSLTKRQTRLLRHEAYLLHWENYIRRTRHVAFWLAIFFIGIWLMLSISDIAPSEELFELLYMPVFLFFCVYTTNLQIRHIDSIKYHIEREKVSMPESQATRLQ